VDLRGCYSNSGGELLARLKELVTDQGIEPELTNRPLRDPEWSRRQTHARPRAQTRHAIAPFCPPWAQT